LLLPLGDRRRDAIELVLRRAIDKVERHRYGRGARVAALAAAQVSAEPAAATVYTMTPERIAATTAARLAGEVSASGLDIRRWTPDSHIEPAPLAAVRGFDGEDVLLA
jgi:hypothetical protein